MDQFNLDYVASMLPRLDGLKTVLDVGSVNVNGSPKELIVSRGLNYLGCDLGPGPGVDVTVDMTADFASVDAALAGRRFDLVLALNVLEHVFEPIKALDNMLALVRPGGYVLVAVPCVWDLHAWPYDYCRLNPDFFTKYAETRKVSVVEDSLQLGVRDTREFSTDTKAFPVVIPSARIARPWRLLFSAVRGLIMPGLKDCWPRTAVHVTLQKVVRVA
jgi:SAM-dependent methyltransferase